MTAAEKWPDPSERIKWEITYCRVKFQGLLTIDLDHLTKQSTATLNALLAEGWEPFAATADPTGSMGMTYHLRRQVRQGVQ